MSGLIFLGSLCSPKGDGLLLRDEQDHAGCSDIAFAGAYWVGNQRRLVSQSKLALVSTSGELLMPG